MDKRSFFLSLGLFAAISASVSAQTLKIDSLRAVLKKDTANFEVMKQLAVLVSDINNTESMIFAKRAKLIALAQSDTSKIVTSSRLVGQLYNRQTNVNMAINELVPLLIVAERHNLTDETKRILNSLAIAFGHIGEYDKALGYHLKSLTLKENEDDKAGVTVSLNNIGVIYFNIGNFDRALKYWSRCLELKLAIHDTYDLDALYLNLGICYKELGDFNKALKNFDRALTTCSPNCSKRIIVHVDASIGELLLMQKKFSEAKSYLTKSLILSKQENDLEYRMYNLVALTEVAFAEHELGTVKNYLNEISELDGKEQFVKPLHLFYKLSSDYYHEIEDFRMASQFDRKYSGLTEKINSSEMHLRLMDIQINFIEKENREKIENQRKLVEAQAKIIENQHMVNFLLFGVAVLTIILLIVFFKLSIKRAAINRRLDELVRERTLELENSRNEFVHSFNEQKIVLTRVSSNLSSSLATIRGLINLGRLEMFENAPSYLTATEETLVRLVESVNWQERDTDAIPSQKKI